MGVNEGKILIEPDDLETLLGRPDLLLVDLSKPETYSQYHIPGALHMLYSSIVSMQPPVGGLLPDVGHLSKVLSAIGLTPDKKVIAYDDEGNGKASRLLWTMDVLGHKDFALLNGGLHAWANEGHTMDSQSVDAVASEYQAHVGAKGMADKQYVLDHIGDPTHVLWDCRSPQEYQGLKRFAERGGHIPGAVNLEWTQAMDVTRNARLKARSELQKMLEDLGITADKTIITYCQTHHRSAHSYMALKVLNYPSIRGYPGSWSEWGNSPDTPVE